MWQINPVDAYLEAFNAVLDNSLGFLMAPVLGIYGILTLLGIVALSVFLLRGAQEYFGRLGPRVLYLGGMGYILDNFSAIADAISKSFVSLGLAAGGGAMAEYTFWHPGLLAGLGDVAAEPLQFAAAQTSLLDSGGIYLIFMYGLAALLLKVSFIVLAVAVFAALIAFKLGVVTAFVLAAASGLPRLAWIASGGFGFVISSGVGLFSYAIVISVVTTVTATLFDGAEPATDSMVQLALITAVVNFGLILLGPSMVRSVMSGVANMGLGAAATAAGAAAMTIAAPVAGGLAVARASQGLISTSTINALRTGGGAARGTGAISKIPMQKAALEARGSSGAIGKIGSSTAASDTANIAGKSASLTPPPGWTAQKRLPSPSSRGISSIHAARALVPDGTDQGGGMMAPSNLERT